MAWVRLLVHLVLGCALVLDLRDRAGTAKKPVFPHKCLSQRKSLLYWPLALAPWSVPRHLSHPSPGSMNLGSLSKERSLTWKFTQMRSRGLVLVFLPTCSCLALVTTYCHLVSRHCADRSARLWQLCPGEWHQSLPCGTRITPTPLAPLRPQMEASFHLAPGRIHSWSLQVIHPGLKGELKILGKMGSFLEQTAGIEERKRCERHSRWRGHQR